MSIQNIDKNKEIVANFYAKVWNAKNAGALSDFVAEDYVQHNPALANGRQPLAEFLEGFFQNLPDSSFTVARLIAENDLVVAHSLFKLNDEDRGTAVVDIYRVADGMLVEHWDLKEAVPEESVNGNPMV